jgi:hypothetical protein
MSGPSFGLLVEASMVSISSGDLAGTAAASPFCPVSGTTLVVSPLGSSSGDAFCGADCGYECAAASCCPSTIG